jgi:ATP-dependent DNA helicase RecG
MSGLLPQSESLTVEFKSDRKRLSDADLVEALVCLANTDGGELWLANLWIKKQEICTYALPF